MTPESHAPEDDQVSGEPEGPSEAGVEAPVSTAPRTVTRRSGVAPRVRPSRANGSISRPVRAENVAERVVEPASETKIQNEVQAVEPAQDSLTTHEEAPPQQDLGAPLVTQTASPEVTTATSAEHAAVSAEHAASTPEAPESISDERTEVRAPRTGRIQVPVPSVVRARERGRIAQSRPVVLRTEGLTKSYGSVLAASEVSISVHENSFTGIVGPNGAGKTTLLSMITGLLRPSSGRVTVRDVDVWTDGPAAKRLVGVLPDRLRLFDRLTGAQMLYYAGVLHGVEESVVNDRATELAEAFGLGSALDRLVSDYSAGMQKKIALASAMIHSPEVLVLDEPFEAIDPVSAANVTEILEKFVSGGGSVIMSSHSLDLIQRVCDHVAVIAEGEVIAQGTVDAVRDGESLEERFVHLTQGTEAGKGLEWLHRSSDSD